MLCVEDKSQCPAMASVCSTLQHFATRVFTKIMTNKGNSSKNNNNNNGNKNIRERLQRISLLRLHFNLHSTNAEHRNYNQFVADRLGVARPGQDTDLRRYVSALGQWCWACARRVG